MKSHVAQKISNIARLYGNTPLLEVVLKYKGRPMRVFAKAEYYNYTGSIKDRMAYYVLKKSYLDGSIKEGDTIVEASSGNAGIAISALGTLLGHRVRICVPKNTTQERKSLIESFGAEAVVADGGFSAAIETAENLAREPNTFAPKQFENPYNVLEHFSFTGPEISRQMVTLNRLPEVVVAGVGTGGTIMGLARHFRQVNSGAKAYALEPASSPVLSTGKKGGGHRIYGLTDDFIPKNLVLEELDGVIAVDDSDAIWIAQQLSRVFGLGVGITSGANLLGAIMIQDGSVRDKNIVTVFADDNKKYLSSDYAKDVSLPPNSPCNYIELLEFRAH